MFLIKHKLILHLRVLKVWWCDAVQCFCRCLQRSLFSANEEETQEREEGSACFVLAQQQASSECGAGRGRRREKTEES